MRRIIEFYFKTLANLNEEELLENIQDQNEKTICRSLISWMHIGSHEIFDDINYSFLEANIEKYREVFKKIFDETHHLAHYNMMMDIR
ncbi:MAG: AAA family ATPase [Ignavibacteriaceae bacterium]